MKKIFIKQHLGLGDCIIHNGMVRKICETHKQADVYVPCQSYNLTNIKFMYRDNPKIKILEMNDRQMNYHLQTTKYDHVVYSHFDKGTVYNYGVYGDDAFYLHAGFDPADRINYFFVQRNFEQENQLYEQLISKINSKEYIFLHEKPEQNIVINRNKISSLLPIIYAEPDYNFFDLLTTIEKAKEVHVISSCFLSFFMTKKINKNTYAHMYADRIELETIVKQNNIDVIL